MAEKPTIDLAVSCDLSESSFMWAATKSGYAPVPAQYILTVHPDMREYAEQVLRALYSEPYRWQERVIVKTDPFAHKDNWTIEGTEAVVRGWYS